MKISLHATNVNTLDSIIKNKIKNELATWEARSDENGYTIYYHSTKSGQWEDELYVKPFKDEKNNKLLFYITEVNGEKLDFDPSFGYLMGRFLEILIVHFSVNYSRIEIS